MRRGLRPPCRRSMNASRSRISCCSRSRTSFSGSRCVKFSTHLSHLPSGSESKFPKYLRIKYGRQPSFLFFHQNQPLFLPPGPASFRTKGITHCRDTACISEVARAASQRRPPASAGVFNRPLTGLWHREERCALTSKLSRSEAVSVGQVRDDAELLRKRRNLLEAQRSLRTPSGSAGGNARSELLIKPKC